MSDNVDQNARLRQHFKDREEQKANSQAGLRPQKVGDPTSACDDTPPPDPEIEESVTVWDSESKGARYWDEATRTLHIVQTNATDGVSIQYTGPTPPTAMDVYCNDILKANLGGGTQWSYNVTYHPPKAPYSVKKAVAAPFKDLLTFAADVSRWEFRAPEFTATVLVYNPDQWSFKATVPPLFESQKIHREWRGKDGTSGTSDKHTTKTHSLSGTAETHSAESSSERDKSGGRTEKLKESDSWTNRHGDSITEDETLSHAIGADGATTTIHETETRLDMRDGRSETDTKKTKDTMSVDGREHDTETTLSASKSDGKTTETWELKGEALKNIGYDPEHGYVESDIPDEARSTKKTENGTVLSGLGSDIFSLTCNTRRQDFPALEMLAVVFRLGQSIQDIKDTIRNTVPEIGWTWDFSYSFLDGEIALDWGWQERDAGHAKSHDVFYNLSTSGEITLVKAGGKIGVGIMAYGVGAQAMLSAEGAFKLTIPGVSFEFDSDGPGFAKSDKIGEVTGTFTVSAYINVSAGDIVSATGGVRGNLLKATGAGHMDGGQDFYIATEVHFDGVELYATVTTARVFNKDFSTPLLGPKELGKHDFLRASKIPEDPALGFAEIKAVVEEAFTRRWYQFNYSFYQTTVERKEIYKFFRPTGRYEYVEKQSKVAADDIYTMITKKLYDNRTTLEMKPRTIEGLVQVVYNNITQNDETRKIDLEDVFDALLSGDLDTAIDAAACPVKRAKLSVGA
ncbi:hypothetical protein ROE7235_02120 [Roseibaca ekhonensis]|uniref:Uncharacterized protein n=1 Tax=Roseinatronobacter ekhonensis TaxID=254356 RepID=A0A3B0MU76_9RHOB|nr:hypothetical protein [Roseibaca ekhonensis]SUZ32364.1 hypothetical protein ROE7235_02120 [Roseibaca ekhonensis]